MSPELLTLPWQVRLSLASGYAAYAIAYAGIRSHHQTIEIAFATLLFGLIATAFFNVLQKTGGPINASVVAFAATIAVGLFWRKRGRTLAIDLLRRVRVSQADDMPSAWSALSDKPEFDVSQIAVQLDDGTWLRCDDTAKFADAPFGPCVLGGNGDLLVYLTHEERPDGQVKEIQTARDDFWGDRATYVPASKVERVTIRHKRH